MIQHIKKLFLAMIALTCFTCFQRADYNLPLFAFSFFLWDYKPPNVPLSSYSSNASVSSTSSSSRGWLTSSGSSTGESHGPLTTTRGMAHRGHPHSYSLSPSSHSYSK